MKSWDQIAVLVTAIIIVILMFPRVLQAVKHTPKGSADDWRTVVLILAAVGLFVFILIKLA
ncbi:MAG TPA: hypothetical protein VFX02_07510 [Gammaproteobacteria bacterium]|nr:hypothetical protein [Gammaproteobacteria bacterium]